MLKDYITKELIEVNLESSNWEDAIKQAGQLMLQQKMIHADYITEMIDAVKKHGPYIAIAPTIAIAHAAPGPSVLKEGISLSILKDPIKFNHEHNDPIKLLFVLAAKDGEGHLSFIKNLVMLLSDTEKIEQLKSSVSVDEALTIIQQY